MEKVTVDDVEPRPSAGDADRRGLTELLGTTDLAINDYRLAPGERISGLHAHGDQEELFVVVEGTVTFETLVGEGSDDGGIDQVDAREVPADTDEDTPDADEDTPDADGDPTAAGEVTVDDGEVIRFGPGEYQSGKNEMGAPAEVLALGAPRETADVRIPLACPECGHDYVRPSLAADGETPVLGCPDCGGESTVECPDCGGDDMIARLAEDGTAPLSACRECGFEAASL